MARHFLILTPLLDDWVSLRHLIDDINHAMPATEARIGIVVVDDGSTEPADTATMPVLSPGGCIERIEVIRLATNLGHQRAIAVGLSTIAGRPDIDAVIVMDSDGEDRPADIVTLIDQAARHPGQVIFAHRAKRSEGLIFQTGYRLHKLLFRALIGRQISFGNFSLIPMTAVRRLVHMPELWNNLAAAILRSRLRYRAVDTIRGRRYAGVSRMNLPALVVHGLSAMATYTDILFVRILLAAAMVAGLAFGAMALVVAIRLMTSLAIPGWATTAIGNLVIIMFQALVIIVATTFMVLQGRTSRPFIPIADTSIFVADHSVVAERQAVRIESTV